MICPDENQTSVFFLSFVICDRAIGIRADFLYGDFRLCDDFNFNNPGNPFNLHSPRNEPETVSKSLPKVAETNQTLPIQLPCTNVPRQFVSKLEVCVSKHPA